MKLLLSSTKMIIQVGNGVFLECVFCSTYNGFRTCLKLELCGCSHLSFSLFLRHLLGDIDIAKSEGKFPMFFICFLCLTTPLVREAQCTPPKSTTCLKNVTLMQTFARGSFCECVQKAKTSKIIQEFPSQNCTEICKGHSQCFLIVFWVLSYVPSGKPISPP